MKVSLTIVKYLILLSCIICITNQYTISINKKIILKSNMLHLLNLIQFMNLIVLHILKMIIEIFLY